MERLVGEDFLWVLGAHIEDMDPGVPCFPLAPDPCGGPVIKVRPFQEWDIEFNVPNPKGKKFTGWSITFSDKEGNCSGQNPPAGRSFPDFLSIRALDMVDEGLGADTWHIGTFIAADNPAGGMNDPRLACLLKAKGGPPTDFIGFFIMSFMYTITICDDCPSP